MTSIGTQRTHTRLEYCRDTYRGAHSLRKKYLIVFSAKASHHDAKDVQKAANQEQPPRTIVIVHDAEERALKRNQHLRSSDGTMEHTKPIMKKICSDGIQETVLGA